MAALSSSSGWSVPPDNGEIRLALIGAGRMAREHARVFGSIEGVTLCAVCGRSNERTRSFAKEFSIPAVFLDPALMMDQVSPDAIVVAVSHDSILDVSQFSLETGRPCLLEKPAGFSSHETARLAAAARAARTLNMVGVNRRFYSAIHGALLAVLRRGPVRGLLVECHEPISARRASGSLPNWVYDRWLVANTIHAIDLLRMLGGEVVESHGIARQFGRDGGDQFAYCLLHSTGIASSFQSYWDSGGGYGLKIFGHDVTAVLEPLECGYLAYGRHEREVLKPTAFDRRFKPGLYAQAVSFLQMVCSASPAPYPASSLEDHVLSMRLAEALGSGEPRVAERRPNESARSSSPLRPPALTLR